MDSSADLPSPKMDVTNTNHLSDNVQKASKSTGVVTKCYVNVVKAEERLSMMKCLRRKGSALHNVIGIARRIEGNNKSIGRGKKCEINWMLADTIMDVNIMDTDDHLHELERQNKIMQDDLKETFGTR